MTRAAFERQLNQIQEDMLVMASMVQTAVTQSIEALKTRDVALAQRIIDNDVLINQRRYDAEEKCVELISLQAPLASDLRTIISVLHITVDLERMGDHAEGNAKLVLMLTDEPPLKPYIDIPKMADLAIRMLDGALDAYRTRDTQKARRVIDMDDEVDELYEQVYHELLRYMIDDPKTIQRGTYLIWVAHNLERVADRVTNICEAVVYLVEGRIQDLNVSKY
jgi:phosphate transport system protein